LSFPLNYGVRHPFRRGARIDHAFVSEPPNTSKEFKTVLREPAGVTNVCKGMPAMKAETAGDLTKYTMECSSIDSENHAFTFTAILWTRPTHVDANKDVQLLVVNAPDGSPSHVDLVK
jgi:hypothetical protein